MDLRMMEVLQDDFERISKVLFVNSEYVRS